MHTTAISFEQELRITLNCSSYIKSRVSELFKQTNLNGRYELSAAPSLDQPACLFQIHNLVISVTFEHFIISVTCNITTHLVKGPSCSWHRKTFLGIVLSLYFGCICHQDCKSIFNTYFPHTFMFVFSCYTESVTRCCQGTSSTFIYTANEDWEFLS